MCNTVAIHFIFNTFHTNELMICKAQKAICDADVYFNAWLSYQRKEQSGLVSNKQELSEIPSEESMYTVNASEQQVREIPLGRRTWHTRILSVCKRWTRLLLRGFPAFQICNSCFLREEFSLEFPLNIKCLKSSSFKNVFSK